MSNTVSVSDKWLPLTGVVPVFFAFLLVWFARWMARGLIRPHIELDESTAVAIQVRNLLSLGLVLLYSGIQALFLRTAAGSERWEWTFWIAAILACGLVYHLFRTIVVFCNGRPQNAFLDCVDLRKRARLQGRRYIRKQFLFCLVLYYFAGLCIVVTVFADAYWLKSWKAQTRGGDPVGVDLTLIVWTNDERSPEVARREGRYRLINRGRVVQDLSGLLASDKSVEIAMPGQLDSDELRQSVEAVLFEAAQAIHARLDFRDIIFHHVHSCEGRSCPIMIHVGGPQSRLPFASFSKDYWDAFSMSAMTLITVGLSDNPPASLNSRKYVIVEQLVGALFFFVFLAGLMSGLTE
jgi:Ion channel